MADFPDVLGYAVIGAGEDGSNPRFCVHGPDPIDTDYAYAHDQWRMLTDDGRSDERYFLCKLVPVEPVEPEGDPEDRLPFDWVRIEEKTADGRLMDPLWVKVSQASAAVRAALGLAVSMREARDVPHPFVAAFGRPYDQITDVTLGQFCAACGCIRSLIAHKESWMS